MILNRAHILLKDDRKDLRIKDKGLIPWQIKYKQREGMARIRNISATGMLIETSTGFDSKDECVFSFDSDWIDDSYIPQIGRMVWQKKKPFSRKKHLCGIKFIEADEHVLARMRTRVEKGVRQFLKKRRITTTIGFALCATSVGLIMFVLWFSGVIYQDVTSVNNKMMAFSGQQAMLTRNYSNLYRSNKIELTQAEGKLSVAHELIEKERAAIALFSRELEATRALLDQTETILITTSGRNVELDTEVKTLKTQMATQAQEHALAQAEAQDRVQTLTEAAREDIVTRDNAKILIEEYRLKMQSIKGEMKQFKQEDLAARTAAILQLDNQKLQLGNNGYFVKDGQVVAVDEDQYLNLTVNEFSESVAAQPERKVEIDVTFFE